MCFLSSFHCAFCADVIAKVWINDTGVIVGSSFKVLFLYHAL